MSEIVLLDSAPLGMLSNPKSTAENDECRAWLARLLARGMKVGIPEVADYEVPRELLRADKMLGVARLDALQQWTERNTTTCSVLRLTRTVAS